MSRSRCLVISIDALSGDDLKYAQTLPVMGSLIQEGAMAEAVLGVYPSLTYPCHATMVTGMYPAHTGILNNECFVPLPQKKPWHCWRRGIRCATIFDAARAAGITTGCVMWPCMGGADIDTLIPEIWGDQPDDDFLAPFLSAGTADLIREIWPTVGWIPHGFAQPAFDEFVTACTVETIRRRAPELLYVHMCAVDNAKHTDGLRSPKVRMAIEHTDAMLSHIFFALKEQNLLDDTNIVVCSDHGQVEIDRVSYVNRFLLAKGLLTQDGQWRIQSHSSCCSAQIHCRTAEDKATAVRLFSDPSVQRELGIQSVYDEDELMRCFSLSGDFSLMLEGAPGVLFRDDGNPGPVLSAETPLPYRANHGHDPRRGEKPIFLMAGPSVRPRARIPLIRLTDEAPTVAMLMGFDLPGTDGQALGELLV